MQSDLTFKQYLELDTRTLGYLDAMKDELGVDPTDVAKIPQVASNFTMGGTAYNNGAYRIKGFRKDHSGRITHAEVELLNNLVPGQKQFVHQNGKYVRLNKNGSDNRIFLVPIAKLNTLMTQGMDGGMGGGGMGGGM
jgi:hypothetical protein